MAVLQFILQRTVLGDFLWIYCCPTSKSQNKSGVSKSSLHYLLCTYRADILSIISFLNVSVGYTVFKKFILLLSLFWIHYFQRGTTVPHFKHSHAKRLFSHAVKYKNHLGAKKLITHQQTNQDESYDKIRSLTSSVTDVSLFCECETQ